jgi:DNA polymerase-1
MQGTAADIIKKAMLSVHAWIEPRAGDVKMVMQVHDELVFEVSVSECQVVADEIRALMEYAAQLSVPLVVVIGSGANWDEAH